MAGDTVQACEHERRLYQYWQRAVIVNRLLTLLVPHKNDFDAIAVSGYSMALIAPIIADRLEKNLILVRKDSDMAHSVYMVEGVRGQRCIIIDDLICSGKTFMRICNKVRNIDCEVVGFVMYHDEYFNEPTYYNVPNWGEGVPVYEAAIRNNKEVLLFADDMDSF